MLPESQLTPAGVRGAFEDWGVKTHTVATVDTGTDWLNVKTTAGGTHGWVRTAGPFNDRYFELNGGPTSSIFDDGVGAGDNVKMYPTSPSQPTSSLELYGPGKGDDSHIDVIINVPLP